MSYRQYILEAIRQDSKTVVVVEAGTKLYHGTSEDFDVRDIRPGGYDSILWTTTHQDIAKTYIPVGNNTFTSSKHLASPPNPDDKVKIGEQRSLGIDYDLSEIEMRFNQVQSYREAPFFQNHPMMKNYHEAQKRFYDFQKEYDDFKEKYLRKISFSHYEPKAEFKGNREVLKKWSEMEETEKKVSDDYFLKYDNEKMRNQIVNTELRKLGYEPTGNLSDSKDDFSWNLFTSHDDGVWKILPFDTRVQGRLLTIVPKKDLKFYDLTFGRSIEGDLTDVDYHKHDEFRRAEDAGYDGIRINDFAQSHNYGNVGHLSYGIFKKAIPFLSISESPAIHEDLE